MKTISCSLLLAVCCFSVHGQVTNNMNTGLSPFPPPKEFSPPPRMTILQIAVDRVHERAESRLVHRLMLDQLDESFYDDPFEFGAKRARSFISEGFTYSLREWGLETPAYAWLDDKFENVGHWFSSLWRDTLSAKVERNNAQSPGDITFIEERARFRGLKKGLRPFSQNPYAFIGYGWRDSDRELVAESTLRLSLRHFDEPTLSFVTEFPIQSWSFGFGVEARTGGNHEQLIERRGRIFTDVDRPLDVTVGLKKRFSKGGVLHIGGDVLSKRAVAVARYSY